jgi:hypothetical protein
LNRQGAKNAKKVEDVIYKFSKNGKTEVLVLKIMSTLFQKAWRLIKNETF